MNMGAYVLLIALHLERKKTKPISLYIQNST